MSYHIRRITSHLQCRGNIWKTHRWASKSRHPSPLLPKHISDKRAKQKVYQSTPPVIQGLISLRRDFSKGRPRLTRSVNTAVGKQLALLAKSNWNVTQSYKSQVTLNIYFVKNKITNTFPIVKFSLEINIVFYQQCSPYNLIFLLNYVFIRIIYIYIHIYLYRLFTLY